MSCENNCVKDYRKKNPNLIYECRTSNEECQKIFFTKIKKEIDRSKKTKNQFE